MSHQKHPHLIHQKYRPDIDGLRAIAILPVVLFHAFPEKMPGGFIGVDIFFVISGFLISTIIFSSLERDRFSLAEFYVRRIRRIFPALGLVLVITLGFGWFVLFANEFVQLGNHTAAGAGFVQNFVLWSESGYFDTSAETKPLLHLWSLAVEEQFYIFWPLLLAFVWKRQWGFLKITATVGVASFAANIYLMQRDPTAAFYLPVPRFWELMIGGMLAYAVLHRPHLAGKHSNWPSFLGMTLIIAALVLLDREKGFPGWWALLPTVGAFLIILSGPNAWLNQKLLANKLMVGIGLISYPLYLWHWVLLSYAHILGNGTPSRRVTLAAVALALLLAWATYQFVEKPARFGRFKGRTTIVLLVIMFISLVAGLTAARGYLSPRNDNDSLESIFSAAKDWEYPPESFTAMKAAPEGIYQVNGAGEETTLFIGDSHMMQYAARVADIVRGNPGDYHKVVFATYASCPPIPHVFTGWSEIKGLPGWANEKRCEDVKEYAFDLIHKKEVSTIVIGAAWMSYFSGLSKPSGNPIYSNYYAISNGERYQLTGGIGVDVAFNNLERFLASLPKDKRVVLMLDNPRAEQLSPKSLVAGSRLAGVEVLRKEDVIIPKEQLDMSLRLSQLAKRANVEYIDPAAVFCAKGKCRVYRNGIPVYKDGNHFAASFIRKYALFIDGLVMKNKPQLQPRPVGNIEPPQAVHVHRP